MKKIRFLLFFTFSITILFAQQKERDSLLAKLKVHESQNNFNESYIDAVVKLARHYRFRDPDSLKLLANKALESSQNIEYSKGKAMSILRLGDYYSDIGQSKLAFKKYEEAKKIAFAKDEFEAQVEVLKSKATQEVFSGKIKDAVLTYYQAITISREQSFHEPEARLRHNLGYFYWKNRLFDEAEKEYLIADSLWTIVGDSDKAAMTASNIALNAIDKKDYVQAKKYADLSINAFKNKGQPLWLSRSYRVKSRWALQQGLFKDALDLIQNSEEELHKIHNPRDQAEIDILFSSIYLNTNDLEKSKERAVRAQVVAEELNDPINLVKCYENLEEIARKNEDIKLAIHYLEKGLVLKDSLNKETSGNNLKLIKAKLDFENNQALLIEENLKKVERQKVITIASLGLLVLLSAIAFLIVRNARIQRKLNTELRQMNASKNQIFSTIGNDLKTPLGTLQELLDLYRSKNITAEEFKSITPRLKTNVDQSAFSLNNLLFWAQTQISDIKANTDTVQLKQMVSNVCTLYQEQLIEKNIAIECKVPEDMSLLVDKEHLGIILRNVISNAIKYSHENQKVIISASVSEKAIKTSICDTGIGMDEELTNNILTEKALISNPGTLNEKGTGLGLGICKKLLTLNNGELEIESELERGSCFHFILPKS